MKCEKKLKTPKSLNQQKQNQKKKSPQKNGKFISKKKKRLFGVTIKKSVPARVVPRALFQNKLYNHGTCNKLLAEIARVKFMPAIITAIEKRSATPTTKNEITYPTTASQKIGSEKQNNTKTKKPPKKKRRTCCIRESFVRRHARRHRPLPKQVLWLVAPVLENKGVGKKHHKRQRDSRRIVHIYHK